MKQIWFGPIFLETRILNAENHRRQAKNEGKRGKNISAFESLLVFIVF